MNCKYLSIYILYFYINRMIGRQLKEKKRGSTNKKSINGGAKKSKDISTKKNILPKISGDIHLSDYGYTLKNKEKSRKTSLKRASKKEGTLTTLRHLNLIRNYTKSVPKNYKKLSKDVEFLKKEYVKEKRSKSSKK